MTQQGDEHAGPALQQRIAELGLRGDQHAGDIAKTHNGSAVTDHDGLAELLRRNRLALGLEHDPLGRGLDEAGAAYTGGIPSRREHVVHGQVVGRQPIGQDLHLQLAHVAPIDTDTGHAGHREQTWADDPVRKLADP